MSERDFKGVWIPKEIWLNDELDALEKVIYTEIDSLSSYEKKCIKSNASLAEFCQCSERKVSSAITKLINLGLVEAVAFDGRHRTLQSSLAYFARQTSKISKAASQDLQASNTYSNSKSNTDYMREGENKLSFEDFWKAYPKKKSKGSAEKAWKKIKPNQQLISKIIKAVETMKTKEQWTKESGQFIPYPATWLNAMGWEDEDAQPEKKYITTYRLPEGDKGTVMDNIFRDSIIMDVKEV